MKDPTYNKSLIDKKPEWKIAWILSQCLDDNAPINWSKYIWVAEEIIKAQKRKL